MSNKTAIRLDLTDNNLKTIDLLAMPSGEKTKAKKTKFVLNQYLDLIRSKDTNEIIKKIQNARMLLKRR